MSQPRLTLSGAIDLGDRLDVLGRQLPVEERLFLQQILHGVVGGLPADHQTFHTLIVGIWQAIMASDDGFSLNPQPLPPGQPRPSDQ